MLVEEAKDIRPSLNSQELAEIHGLAFDELLRASLSDWLNTQKGEFTTAADYVRTKNAELYHRLA